MIKKLIEKILAKKKYALIAGIIIVIAIVYFTTGKAETASYYKIDTATKGTLTSTITASGSISASKTVDLTAKSLGIVTNVYVKMGDEVTSGKTMVTLDASDQLSALREAQLELEEAELEMEELMTPTGTSTLTSAENSLTKAKNSSEQARLDYENDLATKTNELENLEEDLPVKYEEGFNKVTEVFGDLPDVMSDLEELKSEVRSYKTRFSDDDNIQDQADKISDTYYDAKALYGDALDLYKTTKRTEDEEALGTLIDATYEAVHACSLALKEMDVFFAEVEDESSRDTEDSRLSSARDLVTENTSIVNPYLSDLLSQREAIDDQKEEIETAQRELNNLTTTYTFDTAENELSIKEAEEALADVTTPTTLEIKSKQLAIEKAKNSLSSAQDDYSDMFIKAPFDGVVADVTPVMGEEMSASSTAVTLISKNKLVDVSLNEVDISKIEIGQKATVTFDAIEDLTKTATVAEIGVVGNNDSGVVTYDVVLSLDEDDAKIKPGMSADIEIVLSSDDSILMIPKTAISTDQQGSYVQVVSNADSIQEKSFYMAAELKLTKVYVETGTDNDLSTEITSGLSEGDKVVSLTAGDTTEETTTGGGLFGGGGGERPSGDMPSGGPPSQ